MEKFNLEEEIRCDYLITSEVKKMWKIQLELLEKVIEICEKNDIQYFASGGTLLGTVRHEGYIPWDDDIDIHMKRNDYNRFLEIAIKEINDPYFVQCYKTEKNYNRAHIQIRNSNTTAILKTDKYNNFNKGIFIDIFPVDNVPDGIKGKIFKIKVKLMKKILNTNQTLGTETKIKLIFKNVLKNTLFKICKYENVLKKYDELLAKYKDVDTKYCGTIYSGFKDALFERESYNGQVYKKFEYLKMPCPKGFDKMLLQQYGKNYMIPLRKDSTHGEFFFDTEKSYKEYESELI